MRWTVVRLILFRLVPGRLMPIITVYELWRLVQKVRRLRQSGRT